MTYLFCVVLLQVLAIRELFAIITSAPTRNNNNGSGFAGAGIVLAAGLLTAPIILEVAQAAAFATGKPVSLGGDFQALWFMGAAALIILACFSYRFAKQIRAESPHFLAVGANIFGLLIGLYLVFVLSDQVSFYSSRKDTGMLNWALMKSEPELHEIQCESDFLLVRGIDSGTATYRCPNRLQLIYGRLSGAPVVPWPGFSEGKSAALALALKKLQNEATHLRKENNVE